MEIITVDVHEWMAYQNTLNQAAMFLQMADRMATKLGLTDEGSRLREALCTVFEVQAEADKLL